MQHQKRLLQPETSNSISINSIFTSQQINAIEQIIVRSKLIKSTDAKKTLIWLLRQNQNSDRPHVLVFDRWDKDSLGPQLVEAAQQMAKFNLRFARKMKRKTPWLGVNGFSNKVIWAYEDQYVQHAAMIAPMPISDQWQNSLICAKFITVNQANLAEIRSIVLPALTKPGSIRTSKVFQMASVAA